MKAKQVSKGEGSMKIGVDFKHTNQIPIIKVEHVKPKKKGKFA